MLFPHAVGFHDGIVMEEKVVYCEFGVFGLVVDEDNLMVKRKRD